MKRHKKVLFDQIKEEDQGKRKKRSSTIYYFATEAFLNILKIVLIILFLNNLMKLKTLNLPD